MRYFRRLWPRSRGGSAGSHRLGTLQHRGQESSGISVFDGDTIKTHKGPGLVAHVYNESVLSRLSGDMAIGHNRYSTSGGSTVVHAQPVTSRGNLVALAHNGNLPDASRLRPFLERVAIRTTGANDSEMMQRAIEHHLSNGTSLEESVRACFELFTGVFSLVLLTRTEIVAVRDAHGIGPLSRGEVNGGYVFSSETCAIDAIGGRFIRDVRPGELMIVDRRGARSTQLASADEELDIFESRHDRRHGFAGKPIFHFLL